MRYGDAFGYYELNEFPGNKNIVISNSAYIYPEWRNQGKGTLQHKMRLVKARELGYTKMICTVAEGNAYEIKILEKNGWKRIDYVHSHESTNAQMWSIDL